MHEPNREWIGPDGARWVIGKIDPPRSVRITGDERSRLVFRKPSDPQRSYVTVAPDRPLRALGDAELVLLLEDALKPAAWEVEFGFVEE